MTLHRRQLISWIHLHFTDWLVKVITQDTPLLVIKMEICKKMHIHVLTRTQNEQNKMGTKTTLTPPGSVRPMWRERAKNYALNCDIEDFGLECKHTTHTASITESRLFALDSVCGKVWACAFCVAWDSDPQTLPLVTASGIRLFYAEMDSIPPLNFELFC